IYAAGVTLYEMLTGRLPFESETAVGLAYKHISEIPKRPSTLNPNVPPRLDAIVMKSLAKEPLQRFYSAAEMEKALHNLEASGQQLTTAIPVARPNVTAGSTGRLSKAAPRGGQSTRVVGAAPASLRPTGG